MQIKIHSIPFCYYFIYIFNLSFINALNISLLNKFIQENNKDFSLNTLNINLGNTEKNLNVDLLQRKYLIPKCTSYTLINDSILQYQDCTIPIYGELSFRKQTELFNKKPFFMSMHFEYINYFEQMNHYSISLSDKNTTTLNINNNYAFLNIGIFSHIKNNIEIFKSKLYDDYLNNLNLYYNSSIINPKEEFTTILNLLFMKEPYFNTTITKVNSITHYNYVHFNYDTIITSSKMVRIGKLDINIEYSLDNDLNRMEGMLTFQEVKFMERQFHYETSSFTNVLPDIQYNHIESFFITKVTEDILNSINIYYKKYNDII